MATMNPFDLLGDNDNDDPSQLIESVAAQLEKAAPKKTLVQTPQTQQQKAAKLPTKPLPPAEAVREVKSATGRGGGRGFGRGGGRGRGGYNRDYPSNENAFNNTGAGSQGDESEGGKISERRPFGGPRGPYRGGRRGGFNDEERRDGERPRRTFERQSGTGRGNEIKREGSGRGNWGTQSDDVAPGTEEAKEVNEKDWNTEILPAGEDAVDGNKDGQPDETEEKEPEEKEMTFEEYKKVLEEKRKAFLLTLKTEERKVEVDKEFESMQQLSSKKDDESVFIKLSSDKDKRKEASEKEKMKKSVSINEFLKPSEGERYGGRGRGRGRGPRGGGYGGGPYRTFNAPAPAIEDPGEFPTLGGK